MRQLYFHVTSKTVMLVLLVFICVNQTQATEITTDITANTTWNFAGSPYVLKAAVKVVSGATLTIDPGVTVQFPAKYDGGINLTIEGTMIASGTSTNYIRFTGDRNTVATGSFGRFISGPLYIGSTSNSILEYVTIDGLGFGSYYVNYNTAAVDISSGSCTISHDSVKNVLGTGMLFRGAYTKTLANNVFINNTYGVKFRGTCSAVDANHFITNTVYDVITGFDNLGKLLRTNDFMNAGIGLTADIAVTKNDTMAYITSRYTLLEANSIPSGKNLVIQPRVLFEFPAKYDGGITLSVEGNMIAKGSDTAFITFSGDRNSVVNGSFGRYISGPVYFGSVSNSTLQYVVIDGLGFGSFYRNYTKAALDISSSNCAITNCTIQNVLGTGLLYHNFNSKKITGNTFQNNTFGINFENISPLVDSNTFNINTDYDVITGFDNLGKLLPTNTFMDAGIGLTASLPTAKNDTMAYITSRYTLLDANTIPAGKTLTMLPGILLEFPAKYDGGLTLTIAGSLVAKGTADSYITFQGDGSSVDNGSFGRYISGPLYFSTTSLASVLQYVKADGMGFGTFYRKDNTAAIDISSSSCSVLNSVIQNIRGSAIQVQNTSPYIAGSCFSKNRGGVYTTGGKAKILHSNFTGNTVFGVKNTGADTIDATDCWWNNPDGPTNATTNPAGGDVVSDHVLYAPWSGEPFDCSDLSILPLTLLSFQAVLSNNKVTCRWQTASEINTSYFIVQRSTDGVIYNDLGKVYASGNSSTSKTYSFADQSPAGGINYYRLQMTDRDGRYMYSKIVPVNISMAGLFVIYPNPVRDALHAQVQRSSPEKAALMIADMQGKIVWQQSQLLSSGTTSLTINIMNLSKGSYFIIIKGKTTERKLFMKE